MAEKLLSTHGQPQFVPERHAWVPPPPPEEGRKHDSGKPRMDLIPPRAEEKIAQVLTHGAQEHGDWNWMAVKNARTRYIAAAMRHINKYRRGVREDNDMKLPNLAAAIVSLMFVLELDEIEQEESEESLLK